MLHGPNLVRICKHAVGFVEQDGIVIPTSLPELVKHLEIFVGSIIATVMLGLGVFS